MIMSNEKVVLINEAQNAKEINNELFSGDNNMSIFLINYVTHIAWAESPYNFPIIHIDITSV